jgi:hypothetical protein
MVFPSEALGRTILLYSRPAGGRTPVSSTLALEFWLPERI